MDGGLKPTAAFGSIELIYTPNSTVYHLSVASKTYPFKLKQYSTELLRRHHDASILVLSAFLPPLLAFRAVLGINRYVVADGQFAIHP